MRREVEKINKIIAEQELVETIARRICTLNPRINSWERLDVFAQGAWRGEARQILALVKSAGYVQLDDQRLPKPIESMTEQELVEEMACLVRKLSNNWKKVI